MDTKLVTLVAFAAILGLSGTSGAVSEDYVGQTAWLTSSVFTGCDIDANAGGACFHVPDDADTVTVDVEDDVLTQQTAFVTFQSADAGPIDNAIDTQGSGYWICGSATIDVPATEAGLVRVAVGDPGPAGSSCKSMATTGTITATFE